MESNRACTSLTRSNRAVLHTCAGVSWSRECPVETNIQKVTIRVAQPSRPTIFGKTEAWWPSLNPTFDPSAQGLSDHGYLCCLTCLLGLWTVSLMPQGSLLKQTTLPLTTTQWGCSDKVTFGYHTSYTQTPTFRSEDGIPMRLQTTSSMNFTVSLNVASTKPNVLYS